MPNARRAATVRLVPALEAASAGRAIASPTARRERSFHIHRPRCRHDTRLAITTFDIWKRPHPTLRPAPTLLRPPRDRRFAVAYQNAGGTDQDPPRPPPLPPSGLGPCSAGGSGPSSCSSCQRFINPSL